MGLEALNATGFDVDGTHYTMDVMFADDKSDAATTGVAAFREMAEVDEVPVIAFGLGSALYAPLLERTPLPMINILDSTYPSILDFNDNLFLLRGVLADLRSGLRRLREHPARRRDRSRSSPPTGEPYGEGLTQLVQESAAVAAGRGPGRRRVPARRHRLRQRDRRRHRRLAGRDLPGQRHRGDPARAQAAPPGRVHGAGVPLAAASTRTRPRRSSGATSTRSWPTTTTVPARCRRRPTTRRRRSSRRPTRSASTSTRRTSRCGRTTSRSSSPRRWQAAGSTTDREAITAALHEIAGARGHGQRVDAGRRRTHVHRPRRQDGIRDHGLVHGRRDDHEGDALRRRRRRRRRPGVRRRPVRIDSDLIAAPTAWVRYWSTGSSSARCSRWSPSG